MTAPALAMGRPPGSPLGRIIREMIGADGPMSLRDYMALCIGHPSHGYYATRDPLGAAGDFTTAPEISQMFGELIGLWAAETWRLLGSPDRVALVELGPGRGTMMADALRAGRAAPGYLAAVSVHLVETSPSLRAAQRHTLAAATVPVAGHDTLDTVPPGPAIVLANEFFDALPIRQYAHARGAWHERLVGLDPGGDLLFGLSTHPETRIAVPGREGDIVEVAEAAGEVARGLAERLVRYGGAALAIDYGHTVSAPGDTLQAVQRHAFADPLADPGEADLTAHVDFAALARAVAGTGAIVHGPTSQGAFLAALGLAGRATRLSAGTDAAGRERIAAAANRLVGPGRTAWAICSR